MAKENANIPDKTVYLLSKTGYIELKGTLVSFIQIFNYNLVPFMIAIFFIKFLDRKEAVDILTKRLEYLEKSNIGTSNQIEILKSQDLPTYIICNVKHSAQIIQTDIISTKKLINTIK
ncbi:MULTISPECIES: hypothetical protein [unclassified Clostridioides]|uniref:hypothetical protein n=1 Tax=unclassified Clostridioides TaxID=2635829 RepID=UPI001D0C6787|nr:hypothetical protein [Clostridioides sp. ES-S-0001-03]MCC0697026.1 hypothetical protein [Clostridioides sp. ES-S-0048-02]